MSSIYEISQSSLYHYTDMNALINILREDKIVLWATNCLYLNDSNEIIEGAKSIKRVMDKNIQPGAFRNYYLTSFSKASDQLNMWGMYASNGNGCAIGFDYNVLSNSYEIVTECTYGEKETDNNLNNFFQLNKTGYITQLGSDVKNGEIVNNNDQLRNNMEQNLLITTCFEAKHEAYRNEQETRCVIYCNDNKFIRFRSKNGIIIPYIVVPMPKEALKSIIIGPTNKSELSLRSIIHFLMIKGYDLDNISIKSSKIPYRG